MHPWRGHLRSALRRRAAAHPQSVAPASGGSSATVRDDLELLRVLGRPGSALIGTRTEAFRGCT